MIDLDVGAVPPLLHRNAVGDLLLECIDDLAAKAGNRILISGENVRRRKRANKNAGARRDRSELFLMMRWGGSPCGRDQRAGWSLEL